MFDVATLAVNVDTTDLKDGRADMDTFTAAGKRAEVQGTKLKTSTAAASNAARRGRTDWRQIGLQFNQVSQQTAATGNFMQALAIQMPDILLGFGSIGIAAGIAAPAIFALGAEFLGTANDAELMEDRLEDAVDALDAYRSATDLARLSTAQLSERFGAAAEDIRGVLQVLEEIKAREAQRAMDDLAESMAGILAVAGDGDARAEVANFFDVNIFFALSQAAREARDEARLLTAEFVNAQRQLDAATTIQEQVTATQRLLAITEKLAMANGEISAEEDKILTLMAENLSQMVQLQGHTDSTVVSTENWADAMSAVRSEISAILSDLASLGGGLVDNAAKQAEVDALRAGRSIREAAAAAKEFKKEAEFDAREQGANMFQRLIIAGERYQFERGQQIEAELDIERDAARERERLSRAGGRGSRTDDQFMNDFDRLTQQLSTERELLDEWYIEGQEILADRRATELLTQEEHNAAKLALEAEYNQRVGQLQEDQAEHARNAQRNATSAAVGFLNTLAQHSRGAAIALLAVNTGLRISEAIQNTAVAATRALAELGPIAGPPAAAAIKTYGAVQVGLIGANAALRLGGTGGSSGGGLGSLNTGGVAVASSGPVVPEETESSRNVAIQLEGQVFGREQVIELINEINDAVDDGAKIRVV